MALIQDRLESATGRSWTRPQIFDRARKLGVTRGNVCSTLPAPGGIPFVLEGIKEPNIILASDPHFPFFHEGISYKLMSLAKARKIPALAIGGDFFDNYVFSIFEKHDKTQRWQDERRIGQAWLDQMLEVFERIYIIPGNHDRRILSTLQFELTFPDIFELLQLGRRVKVFKESMVSVNDDWLLVHPKSYNRRPGGVPIQLAALYRKHIAMGHTHALSLCRDVSGTNYCLELGTLCDPQRVDYKSREFTTHPMWNIGFAALLDRNIFLFDTNTNWTWWLKA
jgi:predicted phosphodiesterase